MTSAAIDLSAVINILMGIFIMVMGNYLPKAKLNQAVGIRTVWSMENDQTWAASNRFGGKIFIVSGVLIILESILIGGIISTFIMLGIIIGAAIVSAWFSYKIYKKVKMDA